MFVSPSQNELKFKWTFAFQSWLRPQHRRISLSLNRWVSFPNTLWKILCRNYSIVCKLLEIPKDTNKSTSLQSIWRLTFVTTLCILALHQNNLHLCPSDKKAKAFGPVLTISVSVSHLLISINASSNFAIYCAKVLNLSKKILMENFLPSPLLVGGWQIFDIWWFTKPFL